MWLAVLIIVFGMIMVLGIPLPGVSRVAPRGSASTLSIFSLGLVYGLAGGCAGPVFGAILALSAFGGSALAGALTMAVYAVGMVIPLLALAILWDRIPRVRALVRPRELAIGRWRNTWTMVVGGILTISVGILLLVTEGTLTLPGVLGVSEQAALESRTLQATAGVPDWAVLLGLGAAALFIGWLASRSRRATVD